MNQCHFEGRITAKPEIRSVGGDKRVVNFRLAVDRRYKRGKETAKETAFLDCEAWDTGADLIAQHFDKGDPIIVHASVKQEEWEDKNGGGKRQKLKFRVNSFDFPIPNAGKDKDKAEKKAPPAPADGGGSDAGESGDDPIPF